VKLATHSIHSHKPSFVFETAPFLFVPLIHTDPIIDGGDSRVRNSNVAGGACSVQQHLLWLTYDRRISGATWRHLQLSSVFPIGEAFNEAGKVLQIKPNVLQDRPGAAQRVLSMVSGGRPSRTRRTNDGFRKTVTSILGPLLFLSHLLLIPIQVALSTYFSYHAVISHLAPTLG